MYVTASPVPILLVLLASFGSSSACRGCVSLDEYNFDKIISRFRAVLVKFDVAYPYGDKHETFAKLSEELAPSPDLVLAEVGVKDYGERENEALAARFGVGKEDLPALRLFVGGAVAAAMPKTAEWTADSLRTLITDHSDIYIGLPGCLERFDRLAMEFAGAANKQRALEEAERAAAELEGAADRTAAGVYVKFMRKIVENGAAFVQQEVARVSRILNEGKVAEKKKTELGHRLNILRAFALAKDEL